jgi:trehalose 6-phosphate synthase
LSSALLVNPHDADELAEAMDRALTMKLAERQERWQIAWDAIEGATPALWGRNFLAALTRSSLTSPKGMPEPVHLTPPARESISIPASQIGQTTSGQDALTQPAMGQLARTFPTRLS